MANYLSTVYSESEKPLTSYPRKLAKYLTDKYLLLPPASLLEFGCGRCELLNQFSLIGFQVRGNDCSDQAKNYFKNLPVDVIDFDGCTPYEDASFDIVFSKSFIEHIANPESYFSECYRILKPGGVLLSLTPDWRSNYIKFFDDYTHIRPFSSVSLKNIYLVSGFHEVKVDNFKQLPILWNNSFLTLLSNIIAPLIPQTIYKHKIRWIREVMLIGYGVKL